MKRFSQMNLFSKVDPYAGNIEDLFANVRRGDVNYIKTVDQKLLLNARDTNGDTVLMTATLNGGLNLCKEILKNCPSLLYEVNNRNQTVLYQATCFVRSCEKFSIIDFFISAGVDDLATSNKGAVYKKFKRWMNMQNSEGYTALLKAVKYGYLHIVKRLIEVDREYNLGLSKVKVVGFGGKTPLDLAVEKEFHEIVKLLTDEGDPYSDYVPYSTAMELFDRVRSGDIMETHLDYDIMETYLDYIETVELNVLLNSRDQDGNSVLLMVTTDIMEKQLDCCKIILERCPSLLYHHNNDKRSVLHAATIKQDYWLIDFFVSAGLKAVKRDGIENMIRFQKWINLQNFDGNTALSLAVKYFNKNINIVKRFVEVDRQYKLGLSEIVCSGYNTALQWAKLLNNHEAINALTGGREPNLDHGANTGAIVMNTNVASKNNIFTLAEVSKHNNSNDCWLLVDDKVYDVTIFFGDHPGGNEVLLKASGKDATTDFMKVHSHDSNALTLMDKFYVGVCDSVTSTLSKLANDKPQQYSPVQLK